MKIKYTQRKLLRVFKYLIDPKNIKIKTQALVVVQKSFFQGALNLSYQESTKQTFRLLKKIKHAKFFREVDDYLYKVVQPRLKYVPKWTNKRAERDFQTVKKWIIGKNILNIKAGRGHLGIKVQNECNKNVVFVDEYNIDAAIQDYQRINKKFDTILISGELHHLQNTDKLFKKLSFITKKRLIIFEPRIFLKDNAGGFSKKEWLSLNLFSEWLFEKVKYKNNNMDFDCSYNQICYQDIKKYFSLSGLKLTHEEYIEIFPKEVIIHYHWLFILEKN